MLTMLHPNGRRVFLYMTRTAPVWFPMQPFSESYFLSSTIS